MASTGTTSTAAAAAAAPPIDAVSWTIVPMVEELYANRKRALDAVLAALKDLPSPHATDNPLQVAQVPALDDLKPILESQYAETSSSPKKIKGIVAARLYGQPDGTETTIGTENTTIVVPLALDNDPKLYINDVGTTTEEQVELEENHCLHVTRPVRLKAEGAEPGGLVALLGTFAKD